MIKIDIFDSESLITEFPSTLVLGKYAMRVCGTLTEVDAIMGASEEEYSFVETTHGTATAFVTFDRFSDAESFLNVISTFFKCKDDNIDFSEAIAACEG